MDDTQLQAAVKKGAKTLPSFPDGRIDYTNAKTIYGVSIIVEYGSEILLLKRSADLHFFPDLWNVVSGFIDEICPLRDIVLKELQEETGIIEKDITNMAFAEHRHISEGDQEWYIFPVLVQLGEKPDIKINWEHTEFRWIMPEDVARYDHIPGIEENINRALALRG